MTIKQLFNEFENELNLITKRSCLLEERNEQVSIIELLHKRIEEKNYDAALEIINNIHETTKKIIREHNNYFRNMLGELPSGLTHYGMMCHTKELFLQHNNKLTFYNQENNELDNTDDKILTALEVYNKYGLETISEIYNQGSVILNNDC